MLKSKQKNIYNARDNQRLKIVTLSVFLFFAVVTARLVQIQIWGHGFYSTMAQDQHGIYEKIMAERGSIFIKDGSSGGTYPVAINKKMNTVYAVPRNIKDADRDKVAEKVAVAIGMSKEEVFNKIKDPEDAYEIIARKVPDERAAALNGEGLTGIGIVPEYLRDYPGGELAANVVGFLGYSGNEQKGQYGVEGYCNQQLEGKMGYIQSEKDAFGTWISFGDKNFQSAQKGEDVVLTLDYTVQYMVEQKLKEGVEKYKAESGSVLVMNPKTGEIVAMAQIPHFDPNKYSEVKDMRAFVNTNIHDLYESGSVMKTVTMAIALNEGKVTPRTTYVDTGLLKIDDWPIRNADLRAYGVQTMTQVLEKSLNTGAIFAQKQVGKDTFYEYLKSFGLDRKTGIELSGETAGNLSNLNVKSDVNYATASFGQGISGTPLGILTAIASFANEGKLMKPYVIDRFVDDEGNVRKTEPQVVRQVISPHAANLISAMMVNVVNNGHAQAAAIPGYQIAGKTGTAQIANPNGRGYIPGKYIHTFVGFGPLPDAKFAILVKLDSPEAKYAESTAVPLAGAIENELVKYYNLPPGGSAAR